MRTLFKKIIVPTIFIISVFLGLGELKLPLGLVLTATLIGVGFITMGILNKYKNMTLKNKHLIKDEQKNAPLHTTNTQKFKHKRIGFQPKDSAFKLPPASVAKLKLK